MLASSKMNGREICSRQSLQNHTVPQLSKPNPSDCRCFGRWHCILELAKSPILMYLSGLGRLGQYQRAGPPGLQAIDFIGWGERI